MSEALVGVHKKKQCKLARFNVRSRVEASNLSN